MGNSVLDGRTLADCSSGTINKFYTSAAWIEGRAEQQLEHVAGWSGVQKIAAFPDLHPGKYGPVGCAVLADRIYPQLFGNDIGCGMSLFKLDLPLRKFKMEKALRRIRVLGEPMIGCTRRCLEDIGLRLNMYPTSLGTIGGGNHFCEVQTLVESDTSLGLDTSMTYILVHSGSCEFGTEVFSSLSNNAFSGLISGEDVTLDYVQKHDDAVRWACLNRQIIAERTAEALRTDVHLVVDAPHNLLTHEGDSWLHRKGAVRADLGLVPLAGSRATPSFLLQPNDHPDVLTSTAHGAGRRYDRSSMHGRVQTKRSGLNAMVRTSFGGRIVCEDRDLLIEEAPQAYKSSQSVVEDLKVTGAANPVAKLNPLLTFKKTRQGGRT